MGLFDRIRGRRVERTEPRDAGRAERTAWDRRLRAAWGEVLWRDDFEDWHVGEVIHPAPTAETARLDDVVVVEAAVLRDFRFLERRYTVAGAPVPWARSPVAGPDRHPPEGGTVTTCRDGWLLVWRHQPARGGDRYAAPVAELVEEAARRGAG